MSEASSSGDIAKISTNGHKLDKIAQLAENYGDFHKMFVQGLMSAGLVPLEDARTLIDGIHEALSWPRVEGDYETFIKDIINEVNAKLMPNLGIFITTCEATQKKSLVFTTLNYNQPKIFRMQRPLVLNELNAFKKIVHIILQSKYFAVSFKSCTDIVNGDTTYFTTVSARQLIVTLMDINYFAEYKKRKGSLSKSRMVTLGGRAVTEFTALLRDNYDSVLQNCGFCTQIILNGLVCSTPLCNMSVHEACFIDSKKKFQNLICPGCGIDWKDESCLRPRINPMSGGSCREMSRSMTPDILHFTLEDHGKALSSSTLEANFSALRTKRKATDESRSSSSNGTCSTEPLSNGKKSKTESPSAERDAVELDVEDAEIKERLALGKTRRVLDFSQFDDKNKSRFPDDNKKSTCRPAMPALMPAKPAGHYSLHLGKNASPTESNKESLSSPGHLSKIPLRSSVSPTKSDEESSQTSFHQSEIPLPSCSRPTTALSDEETLSASPEDFRSSPPSIPSVFSDDDADTLGIRIVDIKSLSQSHSPSDWDPCEPNSESDYPLQEVHLSSFEPRKYALLKVSPLVTAAKFEPKEIESQLNEELVKDTLLLPLNSSSVPEDWLCPQEMSEQIK